MKKNIILIGILVCQTGVLGVAQQQQQLLIQRPQGNTEMEHAQNVRSQHLLNERILSDMAEEHANQGRRLSDMQDSIQDLVDIQKKKKKKGRFARWFKSFFVESDEEAIKYKELTDRVFYLKNQDNLSIDEFREMAGLVSSLKYGANIIYTALDKIVELPIIYEASYLLTFAFGMLNINQQAVEDLKVLKDVSTYIDSKYQNGRMSAEDFNTFAQTLKSYAVLEKHYSYLFSTAKKVETTTVLTQVVTASVGSALAIASIGSALSLAVAPVVALGIPAIGYGLLLLLRHLKVPMFISLFPGGMLPPWIGALGWIPGMGKVLNFCSNWLPGIQYTKWLSIPLRGGIVVSFCALLCWLIHRILQRWKADADFRKRMKKMLRENRGLLADPKGYLDSMYNRYYLKGIKAT